MGEFKTTSIVHAIMAEKNVSNKQLAKLLNKTEPVISSKMTGRTKFTFEEIRLICKTFDVDPLIFFE